LSCQAVLKYRLGGCGTGLRRPRRLENYLLLADFLPCAFVPRLAEVTEGFLDRGATDRELFFAEWDW